MLRVILALTCGAALAGPPVSSQAATSIDFLLRQAGQPKDVTQAAYIDDGKVLIRAAGGDPMIDLLFQQDNETMTVINHADRTTLDIDAAKVAALANQAAGMMNVVRQQVAKHMENMSEEDRKKLESVLGNLGGASLLPAEDPPAPPTTYRPVGKRTFNGFACEQTEVYEGDDKVSEVCTADPGGLGIPAADFAVIDALRAMSRKLHDQTAKLSEQIGQNLPQFGNYDIPGMPVRMRDKAGNTMTITRVRPGIGDVSLHKPSDYAVKQMPTLPQLTQ